MSGPNMTRRGFLAGLAGSYLGAATGGLSQAAAALTGASSSAAALAMPATTEQEAKEAFRWLSAHLRENHDDGSGLLTDSIYNELKNLAGYFHHAGQPNPILGLMTSAQRLRELDPQTMYHHDDPRTPPDYSWNSESEEVKIVKEISSALKQTRSLLGELSEYDRWFLERQQAYQASRQLASTMIQQPETEITEALETAEIEAPQAIPSYNFLQPSLQSTPRMNIFHEAVAPKEAVADTGALIEEETAQELSDDQSLPNTAAEYKKTGAEKTAPALKL